MAEGPRKDGSTILGVITGLLLLIAAFLIYTGHLSGTVLKAHAPQVEGASCIAFAAILFMWAAGDHLKSWGLGFPSVTMIFAVITAFIAILTLLG